MKKIILGMTLLAAAGALSSCNGFLDEEPVLKQSNELTLAKYDGLDKAGSALYTRMQSNYWYDGQFILQSELRAGNAKNPVSLPGSGRYRDDTQWSYTANSTSDLWAYAYYTITWACNILDNVDGKTESGVEQQDWDNLKAEALFMRALCHFDLVITYAQPYTTQPNSLGVPVILKTENGKPARNTVAEVYDQIVKDLTEAESLISDDFTRAGISDATAMVSKGAIQGLLSRVYLYMGQWQAAADYATKVINSGKYSLATGDDYLNMWTASVYPAKGEVIFSVYGSKKNEYWDDSGWPHLSWITAVDGYGDVCATSDLYDMYEDGDIRKQLYTKNENDNMVLKYAGKEGGSPKETNIPLIRISEMYLNRAEAIAHGASVSGVTAESDLRAIAAARGATAPSPSETSIFDERRKELAFEGHIVYDYARCNKNLVRTDFDGVVNKDIAAGDYKWAMPIPKRELDANPNMVQNPGY
ncbi:MAG: RagB/SusD family nutrient uptake outer membrane protein [Prevotella sp.]|nr:RagB/SusD family nutrient uptake outer membrane protein [Prevotella sp.]